MSFSGIGLKRSRNEAIMILSFLVKCFSLWSGTDWQNQLGANLVQLDVFGDVSSSSYFAIGVISDNSLWYTDNRIPNTWILLKGACSWVSLDANGALWCVTPYGTIYRSENKSWVQKPGANAVNIDAYNATRVVYTNTDGQIFGWNGNDWDLVDGSAKQTTIDSTSIYAVAADSTIWKSAYP